jgi:GH25 family lysozyme M1 (1,4-beta-N-acetylmuramidase)
VYKYPISKKIIKMKAILFVALAVLVATKTPGIDVSAYQGSINWSSVAGAGYKFAILRTTTKGGAMDTTFEANYSGAKNAGLSVSGYHFSYSLSTSEAVSDANNLVTKLNGKKFPIYIDLEWSTQGDLGKQKVTDIAKSFIQTLQGKGYTVGVYSNTNWYKNYYYPEQLSALGCKFWIAQYGKNNGVYDESWKPNVGEYIWQWTSVGSVSGISGNVDLDMMF